MKLDECPWCGLPPRIYSWVESSRQMSIDPDTGLYEVDEYNMVKISCCNGAWSGQIEDAELNWNWKNK